MKRHAIISGTGRAGTSFLVDFLRAVGVPVGQLSETFEHRMARAGLEQNLLKADESYLIKDPWLHEYLDDIDLKEVEIEALIVPIRDLTQAASSRVRIERATLLASSVSERANWSSTGTTPGGVLASLSISDQKKILAEGFARLIHWSVHNEIPLYLLDYPRIIEEPEYLVGELSPWLEKFSSHDHAIEVAQKRILRRTWSAETRRPEIEFSAQDFSDLEIRYEASKLAISELKKYSDEHLDNFEQLSSQHNTLTNQHNTLTNQHNTLTNEHNTLTDELNALTYLNNTLTNQLKALTNEHNALTNQHNALTNEHNALTNQHNALTNQHNALTDEHNALTSQLNALTNELNALTASKAFRVGNFIAKPWRALFSRR